MHVSSVAVLVVVEQLGIFTQCIPFESFLNPSPEHFSHLPTFAALYAGSVATLG